MSRTIAQFTWCQRRRPPPIPTTEEATTWVVEAGAPASDEARITAVEAVWLARPSIGWIRYMPRPTVRMMRQPPSVVPAVSASAQATVTHRGGLPSESMSPLAKSSAATTPIDFCASLAPWLNARPADVTH